MQFGNAAVLHKNILKKCAYGNGFLHFPGNKY